MAFVILDVSDEMEEKAREIRSERDAMYGNIFAEASTDERWVGEVGEISFNRWVPMSTDLPVRWITESAAGKADFLIGDISVGVKTVKRKARPRLDYTAQITARHANEPVDHYFFTTYLPAARELFLLGGISKEEFLVSARYYGPGEKVHPKYTVRKGHEIYKHCCAGGYGEGYNSSLLMFCGHSGVSFSVVF